MGYEKGGVIKEELSRRSYQGGVIKEELSRLQALEMWLWKRMEQVSWKNKKTNIEVLAFVKEERSMLSTITR